MSGSLPDVYSAHDIAAAAGVPESRVHALILRGEIASINEYVPHSEAVRVVKALRHGAVVAVPGALGLGRELFAPSARSERATTVPLILSTSLHGLAVATILFVASLGFAVADERTEPLKDPEPMRMVFLVQPGPGGGFLLTRTPQQMCVLDIIQAVDPLPRIRECPAGLAEHCNGLCPLHSRLDQALATVESSLKGCTLAELLRESAEQPINRRSQS